MGNIYNVDELDIKHEKNPKTKQSANTIFNFMEKSEYLKLKLSQKTLTPRYNCENIEYLNIDMKSIIFPMICFCDIQLHKIMPHTQEYGKYAIAFSKEWGIENNIQPVHYINENAIISDDFKVAYDGALQLDIDNEYVDRLRNYLLTHLLYMKPLYGYMKRLEEEKYCCFQDECEWRYIPQINDTETKLQIIYDNISDKSTLDKLNEAIDLIPKCKINFEYKDIKYIIVPTANDRDVFIDYIMSEEVDAPQSEKMLLISNILILDEIEGDV